MRLFLILLAVPTLVHAQALPSGNAGALVERALGGDATAAQEVVTGALQAARATDDLTDDQATMLWNAGPPILAGEFGEDARTEFVGAMAELASTRGFASYRDVAAIVQEAGARGLIETGGVYHELYEAMLDARATDNMDTP